MTPFVLAMTLAAISGLEQTSSREEQLLIADRALAARVQREGADAFLRAVVAEAPILFTGQPILRGPRDASADFVARYGSPASYTWSAEHAMIGTDGRFGCTAGFSRFTSATDPAVMRPGVYLTCWRKSEDGAWRIVAHQRNDSPAVPPNAAADLNAPRPVWPKSSSAAASRDPRTDAQNADAAFGSMAEEPAGPGPAFARFAAADAMLLTVQNPTLPRGPEEIAKAFERFPSEWVLLWQPMRTYGDGSGGLAFTVGHSVTKPRTGNSDRETYGKFLTIWRENGDGSWSYILDLGSPR